MKRQLGQLAVLAIWGAGLGLAVLSYNLLAPACGGCASPSFLSLGLPAYGFLGLIGAGVLILVLLKWRRRVALARRRCGCGSRLDKTWHFCPDCGSSRRA